MDGARPDVVPLAEAAERLELSTEAVRKRIQRGTLPGRKIDGAWFVEATHLPPPSSSSSSSAGRQDATIQTPAGRPDAGQPDGRTDGRTATGDAAGVDLQPLADVIAALTQENRDLAGALGMWQERARVLEGRLLALGTGEDAPTRPPDAPGATQRTEPAPDTAASWWRRWFRRVTERA